MIQRLLLLGCTLFALAACGSDATDATDAGDAGATTGEAPPVSVRVMPAEVGAIQSWIYSQGTARAIRREFLSFTEQGRVTHVADDLRPGSPVKRGQLLAHQAPERPQAELSAARAAVKEAEATLNLARVTLSRYQTLVEQRSASRQELDQARVEVEQAAAARDSARAQLAQAQVGLDDSRLVSPIDGVLARLNIEEGRYFSPQAVDTSSEQGALRSVPALVIDPSRFEVRADLPSYLFRDLAAGARAQVGGRPPRDGDQMDPDTLDHVIRGEVHAISPSLDPETRTFEVIVQTTSDSPRLQDGEFVALWIARPAQESVLTVPMEAVRNRNDQSFVFVLDDERQIVTERRVTLGQQAGDRRAVLSGLEPGERVVTDGRARLNDGQKVRVIEGEAAAATRSPASPADAALSAGAHDAPASPAANPARVDAAPAAGEPSAGAAR